jgi:hypothetical protein
MNTYAPSGTPDGDTRLPSSVRQPARRPGPRLDVGLHPDPASRQLRRRPRKLWVRAEQLVDALTGHTQQNCDLGNADKVVSHVANNSSCQPTWEGCSILSIDKERPRRCSSTPGPGHQPKGVVDMGNDTGQVGAGTGGSSERYVETDADRRYDRILSRLRAGSSEELRNQLLELDIAVGDRICEEQERAAQAILAALRPGTVLKEDGRSAGAAAEIHGLLHELALVLGAQSIGLGRISRLERDVEALREQLATEVVTRSVKILDGLGRERIRLDAGVTLTDEGGVERIKMTTGPEYGQIGLFTTDPKTFATWSADEDLHSAIIEFRLYVGDEAGSAAGIALGVDAGELAPGKAAIDPECRLRGLDGPYRWMQVDGHRIEEIAERQTTRGHG